MSWEVDGQYKTKCPCRNGQIIQDTKSDDFGRVIHSRPIIKCDECSSKYKVIEVCYPYYYRWKGDHEEYYLVPIDFIEVEEPVLTFSFNINEYKSFDKYITLIKLFKKQELEKASLEISNVNSCKEVLKNYISYEIIKDLRKIYGTAKIKQIKQSIAKALEEYKQIHDNKDEFDRQKEVKKSNFSAYIEHVKTIGIKIDFSK